jgi:uridine kinase
MRVALLIAGYLRNYKKTIEFIEKEFKGKEVDIFLHITKNENTEDKYFNNINDSDIEYITKKLKPISTIIETNYVFNSNTQLNNTINHWSKLYRLNNLKRNNEKALKFKYDLVIRYRPDLEIITTNIFDIKFGNNIIIPSNSKIDKDKLNNKEDLSLCDALAFGSSKNMDKYFKIYENISNLVKYGNVSETLLYRYLNDNNIKYKLLDIEYNFILSKCNVFAICGDSGSGKSTLSNILKNIFNNSFKLECDRYHKWERHDKNWENITHLNPKANYITKMNEDIFNLKIGNEIYQVDYNHSTGKFTEKQLINPSNNLIVCGLHTLYENNNDNIYDLKIYMDTDVKLKNKWKLIRDVKERGYNFDKVLSTIIKRETDFKQYIDPQKENADIIINFYPLTSIDYNKLDEETLVGLNLVIDKRFDIKNITDELNINFKLTENKNSYIINFTKYEDNIFLNKFNIQLNNNYYDYILFFILNLKNS